MRRAVPLDLLAVAASALISNFNKQPSEPTPFLSAVASPRAQVHAFVVVADDTLAVQEHSPLCIV